MRLIDADKLVEEIKEAQDVLQISDDKQWERNKKYFKGLAWAHKIVLEQPTIKAEPKWIPCSERLPEEKASEFSPHYTSSDVVFVSVYSKKYGYEIFKNFLLDGKWSCERQMSEYKVLAWMPLPEPYKGE